ncbi:hypothetical protein [Variovorax sp. Varisp36]|uniref:hypothetical protein n=1 Tax=Variovorax sp. Varisp36 TaxID=3243031 RepID=UPI0039A6A082
MPVDRESQKIIEYFEMLGMRIFIAELVWTVIGAAIFFGLLYLTLRYAIRDGLRDSQREDRRVAIPRERDRISAPDMRAD